MSEGGVTVEDHPKTSWNEEKALVTAEGLLYQGVGTSKIANDKRFASLDVQKLLDDRDHLWRQRERSRCDFIQGQQERLLACLHKEIDQLQRKCGSIVLELAATMSGSSPDVGRPGSIQSNAFQSTIGLYDELESTRAQIASIRELIDLKDQEISIVEQQLTDQENRYRGTVQQLNQELKVVTADLNQKSGVATQMMTQTHHLRLREAVQRQKREIDQQQAPLCSVGTKPPDILWTRGVISTIVKQRGQLRNPSTTVNPPPAIRSSILPPIVAPNIAALASSVVNNIEKPSPLLTKPLTLASFRRKAR